MISKNLCQSSATATKKAEHADRTQQSGGRLGDGICAGWKACTLGGCSSICRVGWGLVPLRNVKSGAWTVAINSIGKRVEVVPIRAPSTNSEHSVNINECFVQEKTYYVIAIHIEGIASEIGSKSEICFELSAFRSYVEKTPCSNAPAQNDRRSVKSSTAIVGIIHFINR